MLGQVLVTKQTGPEGRLVSKVLIEAASSIKKEFYRAVLLDRSSSQPIVMASTEGGMDIEEVATRSPEKIIKETVDPAVGMMAFQARKLAAALGIRGDLINPAARLLLGVYKTWWECDASLVEINPLCVVAGNDGKPGLLAVDAKISFDDNALYRHPNIQAMRDLAEEAPEGVPQGSLLRLVAGADGKRERRAEPVRRAHQVAEVEALGDPLRADAEIAA